MTVSEIIQGISYRLKDTEYRDYPGPDLLITMNQMYQEINDELRSVVHLLSIPAGTFSDTVKTYNKPDDMVEPFNVVPGTTSLYGLTYINKNRWNPTQYLNHDVFTMINDQLVFGNVSATTSFELYYYSSGKELVDESDAQVIILGVDDYANTPEWKTRYHKLLVYETCIEIADSYAQLERDVIRAERLTTGLRKDNKNRQTNTPAIIGGLGASQRKLDPDYVNGLWVTR